MVFLAEYQYYCEDCIVTFRVWVKEGKFDYMVRNPLCPCCGSQEHIITEEGECG